LVVSDVQMEPMDGRELMRRLRERHPAMPVLLMTAYGTIDQAVSAMRDGAVDYLVKPFEAAELERRVCRYLRPLEAPSADPRREPHAHPRPTVGTERHALVPEDAVHDRRRDGPIVEDPRSRALLALAEKVAASDVTVLLSGESGTGKEVLARFIHDRSKRRTGPFVAVNCAAIPDQMLEALLFGHERGAFTGAQTRSQGKFVQANGGTLLLDEITEMELGLQAKLLRVLQEREVEPLGASKPIPLDVRVLATSNRDLERTVNEGRFREDLYYRLSVFPLHIPPLRERPGDIAALARRFIERRCAAGDPLPELSAQTVIRLENYAWPGNVRELENAVQRAIVLGAGETRIEPWHMVLEGPAKSPAAVGLAGELWEEEARRIVDALSTNNGRRKQAAEQLGISGRTLRYKLTKLRAAGIAVPGDRLLEAGADSR
jgi:two-component system response regulator FlrC